MLVFSFEDTSTFLCVIEEHSMVTENKLVKVFFYLFRGVCERDLFSRVSVSFLRERQWDSFT